MAESYTYTRVYPNIVPSGDTESYTYTRVYPNVVPSGDTESYAYARAALLSEPSGKAEAYTYVNTNEASLLSGYTFKDVYLSLDESDRPADPKGSYARRIAEGLVLDTSNRGSGSWEKIIAQTDEEPSTSGSWRARARRFIRRGVEE